MDIISAIGGGALGYGLAMQETTWMIGGATLLFFDLGGSGILSNLFGPSLGFIEA